MRSEDAEEGHRFRHFAFSPEAGSPSTFMTIENVVALGDQIGAVDPLTVPAALANAMFGHARPWREMSAIARKKFQQSYSRHAGEFGLPPWRASQAEALQAQFNTAVGRVRASADLVRIRYKPVDGVSARVRYFEATLNGQRFYHYELLDVGRFISAGRV